jgi:hypothetical protein
LVLDLSQIYLFINILLDNMSPYLGQLKAFYCIIQKMQNLIPLNPQNNGGSLASGSIKANLNMKTQIKAI